MPESSLIVSEDPGIAFNLRSAEEQRGRRAALQALEGQERLNIAPPLRLHQRGRKPPTGKA